MIQDFELIQHTADLKIRVYGNSLAELFKHALMGMFQVCEPVAPTCTRHDDRLICANLPEQHQVTVHAVDRESLLVAFLSHALYLSDTHNQAYFDVTLHAISDTNLQATLHGVQVTGFNVEIKAVTYHEMHIESVDGRWKTDVVFDI